VKRAAALAAIRAAGATGDQQAMLRLYVENRISYDAAIAAYCEGSAWRKNGQKVSRDKECHSE